MRFILVLIVLLLAGAGATLFLTRGQPLADDRFAGLDGNPAAGELVFTAAGCASCHMPPDSDDPTILSGGERFETQYGVFVAPNISTDVDTGIGAWSLGAFANAVLNGVSPEGAHYYPAFPYTSYSRMTDADVSDLWAYMQTLPAVSAPNQPHELALPFQFREALGPWKMLYLSDGWRLRTAATEQVERGRYLVEALGHCGECHTDRNALGAMVQDTWLAGAPNPSGQGRIPGIHPGVLEWSEDDIAYYLETGFTPDFDSAGGSMTAVVRNTAKLPASDREAIAAYLKAVPAR